MRKRFGKRLQDLNGSVRDYDGQHRNMRAFMRSQIDKARLRKCSAFYYLSARTLEGRAANQPPHDTDEGTRSSRTCYAPLSPRASSAGCHPTFGEGMHRSTTSSITPSSTFRGSLRQRNRRQLNTSEARATTAFRSLLIQILS